MQELGRARQINRSLTSLGIELVYDCASACAELSGELDLLTAPQLLDTLEELLLAGYRDVRIDLTRLEFLGCAGMTVLLAATRDFRVAGGRLRLTGTTVSVRRLLMIAGVDTALEIDCA